MVSTCEETGEFLYGWDEQSYTAYRKRAGGSGRNPPEWATGTTIKDFEIIKILCVKRWL